MCVCVCVYRYTEEPSVRVNNPHVQTVTTYTPRSSASAAAAAVDSTGDNDDVWCKVCKSLRRDLAVNQAGAEGEEAGRRIANGGARQR